MTGNGTLNSALPDDTDVVLRYSQRFKDPKLRKALYEVAHQKRAVGEPRDAISGGHLLPEIRQKHRPRRKARV